MKLASAQTILLRLCYRCLFALSCAVAFLIFSVSQAATLTWDANGSSAPNPADGSGTWLTANDWWNGSANVSGTWSGATPDSAVFGAGVDGNYAVALTGNASATSLTFNNSGYTISGSGTITLIGGGGITVAAGKTASVNNTQVYNQNNTETFTANAGSTLNIDANLNGMQSYFSGVGTINLSGSNTPSIFFLNSTVNLINGGVWQPSSYGWVGYSSGQSATLTITNASWIMNGSAMAVANNGATGNLIIQNNANVLFDVSGANNNAPFWIANNGANSGTHATVDMQGGTVTCGVSPTVPSGAGYCAIVMMGQGGAANQSAIFTQEGGTITAWQGIWFGSASAAYTGTSTNSYTMSGGNLYLGSSGLNLLANHPTYNFVTLSGGTVGALQNWNTIMPITLGTANGNVTFQCADASSNPYNITLSGGLTGSGGMNVSGSGSLTLSASNTYTGGTIITAGNLLLAGNGSAANNSSIVLTNGGTLTLSNSATANLNNRLNDTTPITMNGGGFVFANDGSATSFSETVGALVINSGLNTVTTYAAAVGQTSTLTFSSLTYNGGSVNFQMGSVGTSQNRIFFTTPPTLGGWITVNGSPAAYDSTNGLQVATSSNVDIAALGSTITNGPNNNVRINTTGSGGNIQLGSNTTTINSLQQNTSTAATVNTSGKTLNVNQISINAGLASLTIGASPGAGFITTASQGGNLTLVNSGSQSPGLIINATLTDNIFPSKLTVTGSGIVTLAAPNNTLSGGTTISNATLAITTGTTAAMTYTNINGILSVKLGGAGTALPMNNLTFGGAAPKLTCDTGKATNSAAPLINITGNLSMNGNVSVNVTNASLGTGVLLQYSGTRNGSGRFVTGTVPSGLSVVDDPVSQAVYYIYISGPTVVVPPHNTNEIIVALATPQQYGAVGDGVTDDTAAFQAAMNAVSNPGGFGGGIVYVPAGVYAFSNTLTIPYGVTLQGDWTDWSQGSNGVAGTLFEVYAGAGQTNGTPFIFINKGAIKGISFWYPNQNPSSITPYPFTLQLTGDTLVQDIALINSYQGINAYSAAKHVLSTVIGSPLFIGITVDAQYDISHQEDVRFSPDFWPASQLAGAPASGGSHATWMRTNGTAELMYRADGEACMDLNISGYNVGVLGLQSTNGGPNLSFYGGCISNCATAYLDGSGGGSAGVQFTRTILDGDIAVDRTSTPNDAAVFFHSCQLTGRKGTALHQTGGSSSTMQFQSCTFSNTVRVDGGIANFVNCSFSVPPSSNHCVMASGAIYANFTGCIFNPARTISNAADARRLVIDARRASTSPLPVVRWSDIKTNWITRRPAKLDLFVATLAAWGAVGDGVADDTAAIQKALNAAMTNGGGIVYLPAGKYMLSNTLDVPSGVELRGSYPSVHESPLYDGHVKITVLQPYAGAGTTNGAPAVTLEANAGIVGMTIQYEQQNTNCTPYPPTIQGRGGNIYAIGVLCPNPYWFVDMNTYTCTNHFLQQVDGWALRYGFTIGNGSFGTLVQCMANETYWWDANFSASQDIGAWRAALDNFCYHNQEWFLLGDCTELLVKDFDIPSHIFMHCIDQNGRGPWVNGIITECDASVECFQFDAAAPCQINIVNPEWMVTLSGGYGDLTNYGVVSLPTFQGTARFFNSPLWGPRPWDYWIQGGDVGFELAHLGYLSTYGSKVDGGVLHLINCGFEGSTSSYYTVPFNSASPGVAGKLSEIIGCFAWTGVTNSKVNVNNPINIWGNFGINNLVTQTPFNITSPQLQFSRNAAAQKIFLTWTNNMGAFNLYSTPSLSPAVWALVTNAPYFAANNWTVTNLTAGIPQQFYRLQP
jgi:autotransporter-associated beta strand protein